MCVRPRLLRTAHTQAYTQWRRGAARSVYQPADSLQKLKSESLHHGSSTWEEFLCRLIVFWRTRGESAEKGATKTRSDAWQAGIALARKFNNRSLECLCMFIMYLQLCYMLAVLDSKTTTERDNMRGLHELYIYMCVCVCVCVFVFVCLCVVFVCLFVVCVFCLFCYTCEDQMSPQG